MTPERIGRYEIKSELGRGGMATVYRAYDPRFKREVAIKVLPPQFLHDPTFRARFEREAQMIAAIEDPAIVPVYDYGEEDGQPYLVMRYMQGGSLSDRLQSGPLTFAESARILAQLAPALDEMHGRGMVHRDLKPGNILFDRYGNACLSDFGIARLTQATTALTGDHIIGTPAYMSPEQARGDIDIDGRSDIYALGAILFEMLTGKQPYQATTPMGVALKQITEPAPRILAVRGDLPPESEELIARAMAKKREERYQTASELAATQQSILHRHTETGGEIATPPPAPAQLPADRSRSAASEWAPPGEAVPSPGDRAPTPPPAASAFPAARSGSSPLPRPQARRPWGWLLAGAVLLGGLCILGSALLLGGTMLPGLLAQGSPTATHAAASPAAASNPPLRVTDQPASGVVEAPTATAENAATSGPRPTFTAGLSAFIDDFSDPRTGWFSGDYEGTKASYDSGSYRILVDVPNTVFWSTPDLNFENVIMEVDAVKVAGADENYYGLACRIQDGDNFYLMVISGDGYYSIGKYKDGNFQPVGMENWAYSDAIHQGKVDNRLRADCVNETLTFYANGTRLASVTDRDFRNGDIGLAAATFNIAGTNVLFDNFSAKMP